MFGVLQLEYGTCLVIDFQYNCLVLFELPACIDSCLSLILKILVIITSNIFLFCSIFSSGIPIIHMLHILKFFHSFWMLCSVYIFILYSFLLHFSLVSSIELPLSSRILPFALSGLWMNPSKAILFLFHSFFIFRISFDSFLEFSSVCRHYASVLPRCVCFPSEPFVQLSRLFEISCLMVPQ